MKRQNRQLSDISDDIVRIDSSLKELEIEQLKFENKKEMEKIKKISDFRAKFLLKIDSRFLQKLREKVVFKINNGGSKQTHLCILSEDISLFISMNKFENYLLKNYPVKELRYNESDKKNFNSFRGVVFYGSPERIYWLDKQIKIELENEGKA